MICSGNGSLIRAECRERFSMVHSVDVGVRISSFGPEASQRDERGPKGVNKGSLGASDPRICRGSRYMTLPRY